MVQVKILEKAWPSKMGASAHANRLGGSVKGEVKSIEDWVGGWDQKEKFLSSSGPKDSDARLEPWR